MTACHLPKTMSIYLNKLDPWVATGIEEENNTAFKICLQSVGLRRSYCPGKNNNTAAAMVLMCYGTRDIRRCVSL